jgi:hypothetical protein
MQKSPKEAISRHVEKIWERSINVQKMSRFIVQAEAKARTGSFLILASADVNSRFRLSGFFCRWSDLANVVFGQLRTYLAQVYPVTPMTRRPTREAIIRTYSQFIYVYLFVRRRGNQLRVWEDISSGSSARTHAVPSRWMRSVPSVQAPSAGSTYLQTDSFRIFFCR